MSEAHAIVQTDRLVKHFPAHRNALAGVSVSINAGESVSVTGPNGSGKSTLFKALLGLTSPSSGTVRLFGEQAPAQRRRAAARIGALLEGRANVYERLTAYENARYFCGLRGRRFDRAHFSDLCASLDFGYADRPIRRLSTGNRQRAALVVALVHRPDLVLLDEPTLGLDVEGVDALQRLLQRLGRDHGATVLLTSHDPGFIGRACRRSIGLDGGRVAFDRTVVPEANSQYRLAIEMAGADASATAMEGTTGTFGEQLARLQRLARGRVDIRSARIYETTERAPDGLETETEVEFP